MLSHRSLRALSAVPAAFGGIGILIAYMTIAMRSYWAPLPRLLVAGIVFGVAVTAIVQLWRGDARAPLWILLAGAIALSAMFSLGWLFPLVRASSEPLSLLERIWYPATVATIVFFALGAAWASRHLLAMRSTER